LGQAGNRTPPHCRQRSQGSGGAGAEQEIATLDSRGPIIKTVNLKSDMPSVQEALQRLDKAIAIARQERHALLKVVHGYGSTGAGGDIRIAAQKRLHEMTECGQIRGSIFGENWSKTDEATWRLLQAQPELKNDPDLGRRNQGITIILL